MLFFPGMLESYQTLKIVNRCSWNLRSFSKKKNPKKSSTKIIWRAWKFIIKIQSVIWNLTKIFIFASDTNLHPDNKKIFLKTVHLQYRAIWNIRICTFVFLW